MITVLPLQTSIDARRRMGEVAAASQPFTNSNGTLHGRPGRWDWDGREATYTVFSYDQAIAWRLADGAWIMPDVKYSVTTSKHQGFVKAWVI